MSRPGMSDGRQFTSYISSTQLNDNIQRRNNVGSDASYRHYLQNNGVNLIKQMGDICFSKEKIRIPCNTKDV